MKRILSLSLTAAALLVVQIGIAQITGTAHDFSTETWNTTGEICKVCHTPHNALTSVADAPLWNHTTTSQGSYSVYSSTTLQATVGQPAGVSKLCLSCHDGTVGLQDFGGNTYANTPITGDALLGTSLSNDHPISFTYDATLATNDGELYNPTTQTSGLGSTISADMLFSGKMECASCHDVHGTGNDYLLLKANTGSALCLTCHNK